MIASRISYCSSHFAMVEAYRMIRSGICEAAVVASINLCINPCITHQFFCLEILSTNGYCKPFDEEGNGYMRSDSVAVMYLQKAKNARRIYATFVYGKTNCDGFKEEGITFPSFDKQKMLLEEFYEDCDISPLELFYIEAHATGTPAGDPVELRAIDEALCDKRQLPLLLGSVKSNIGHSEVCSGHCQITKILIAMETGILAPTIHFKRPRKNMRAILEGRVKIITEPTEYKDGYIGINSFGFGGANCHILLKPNPKIKINNKADNNLPRLVAISGCTEEAVKIILDDVQSRSIDVEYISLLHRIHNDNIKGHSYRGYIIAGSNISDNAIIKIERNVRTKRPICFIFSGLGSQCFNMGRALIKFPAFIKAIQKCDTILRPYNISVTDIIINKNKDIVDNIVNLFVGLIGLQIGIIDLLTSIGIIPDIIMGHSIGELICGYVDGCLTADETIMLAYYVGLAFFKSNIIDGLMAEINLNFEIMKDICPSDIDVACYNNLHNSIVSGPKNSVRTFLANIPFHSRYAEPARVKLLEYLNQILPQQVSPSSKWLSVNESYEWFNTSPKLSLAKYYAHHLLAPVLFSKSLRFIPNNAVTIEIASRNILQYILNDSLETTVTNPKIANLYPEVKFPVSRGEVIVTIDVSDEEFIYMTGHVINGKNLLPATGYLLFIWQIIGSLKQQNYIDIPIVFEDVNFLRSIILPKQSSIDLTLMMQKGSNKFEIIEGNNTVVTGTVRIPINIEDEKICTTFIDRNDNDEEVMSTKDIYKELKVRGYQYTGEFRGLKSASIRGKNGHIVWTDNWATFMDNMLQMMILGLNSRSLFVPTRIRKVVIDPESHIKQIEKLPNEEKHALISGGIEISGILAIVISRQQRAIDPVLEEYKFVAHQDLDVMSLEDTTRMSVHIALECYNMINVKIVEFVEDSDQVMPENLNCLFVNKVLEDISQIQSDIKLVATQERFKDIALSDNISTIEFDKLTKNENCLMIIGYKILTKNIHELYERLLPVIMPKGFLLTFEELDAMYDYSCLDKYGLKVILEKRTKDKTIILLRKIHDIERSRQIVHINNYEFSWIDRLKSFMNIENETTRIIVVAEEDFECGLIGLVNCLRKEPGGKMIRGVFIQDKDAPTFSLQEPLYRSQLQLDLPINVIRSRNIWGSYRHFPLPLPQPKLVKSAYVSQMVRGDLSTFCWMQSMISLVNNDEENLIRIVYASINFKDVMIASGRLILTSVASFEENNSSLIEMEIVGFNKNGQRVMGMCPNGGFTNVCIADKYLSWVIPDQWTMEDAATIPCVYSTCYYALYLKGKMKKGDKILIHSGTGDIGQAAIHLALYEGTEIFTTVGSSEKRNFIRETFPSIPEDHIGNSRDTSFEQMIMQKTKGRGVDIVLNSLAEEKLQTSIHCLAKGGRFLEIGKFDMISNNPLEIFTFSKGISFHGIILDNWIFCAKEEDKMILHNKIIEGIKKGAIKPLCRKVFERDEIETAFRYMAAGKHIGKIIIKIPKENELLDAPILAHPRYYCLERKCYIVLGGLGGFGLELIDWLILRGAKNLVVTLQIGIKNGYQRSRVTLWQSYGVNIQIVTAIDTSRYRDCKYILKFVEEQGPVDAIFNLAVVLNDNIFKNQSPQTFEETFVSKAWTTKNMDELSRNICTKLRHFVVFSSWGAIGEVGLVADMREDDKELVIRGTLQQNISSCLNTLEVFLLQDRSIVSSMVVAEKKKSSQAMNQLEAVANIMGLKNLNKVSPNVSLAELGMDSMMAVEIKQTLEREFDILMTEQDIRNLNFSALRKMINATEQGKTFEIFTQKLKDSDLNPNIYVELDTKREVTGNIIFLIPGIDGSASVYKQMESKIKFLAICLQHGAINMPNVTRSVMKSAAYLLPYVMEKMKDQKEFLIVGYSFGSLIAIELARLLEAKNFIGRLILIDGAPDWMKFLNLKECSTWEEKLELITVSFSEKINMLSVENQKLLCTTIYDHIIAAQDYDISSFAVQIHYIEGSHITMMNKIASFINEAF
ncbi:hypothetical protein ACFW04_001327 [Cataglyphis niger]